jgi:hypothetical protein
MEKYDGVLKELAALLVPHLIAHPDMQASLIGAVQLVNREQVEEIVQAKMDALGPIDKDMVREVCEEVIDHYDIDDKINEYMTNSFDISDWQTEIRDIVDLDDVLEDRLPDAVATCVQHLSFTVEVSTR